ncbi:efflux RND transporter periplasmic adaptor subunit [Candidatus Roizmanbacteria bacterium]|nr:efflux RND transporter periplasmic adaptor subunit [Candidatus Roizmanbacteria bacterium]
MMKFLKKRWFLLAGVVIIGGALFYNNSRVSQTQQKKEKTYKVKKETLTESLSFSGKIDAQEKATLRFKSSGRIAWVGVKEGDTVKKYQVIATQDQREIKKDLQKELNDYAKERADFDQSKDDNKVVTSDKIKRILEQAQYDLNNTVIDVELENLSLEYSNLVSPIDGIVTKVMAPNAGVHTTPTQAEFVVINPATLYFSAVADQTEVVKLNEGKTGSITLDSFADKTITGTISSIAFTPKEGESGTVYEVKLQLEDKGLPYRMGMTGDVSFILSERPNQLVIPENFIHTEAGKKYVFLKKNDKKVRQTISTGETIDGETEVKSGLQEGDVVYD